MGSACSIYLFRANDLNVEDMIKRSFSEFAIQRAVSNKDTHQALIKSEKFLTLINNQISDDISNVSKDSEAATQSMFEDLHESLRQSYELTQAFISSSVRTNPPDKTRRSEGITVNDCTVVPLLNLSLAINRGRIFLCKRCDCAVIAMALSEPLFPLKEEPVIVATANSNANAGSSLSDIRKKLLATSVQPTVSSNVNATMDKGESVIDEALKDGFVIALVLLPPANSTTDLTMVEDSPHLNKALITGEYTSDSGLLLNYSIERVKLADIAVITDALDFTALSVDPITYSDVNINNSVQTLFHFVRALKNNAIQGTLHALDLQKTLRRSDIDAAVMQNQLDAASQYVTLCKSVFMDKSRNLISCVFTYRWHSFIAQR